jgi:hypothetical protein
MIQRRRYTEVEIVSPKIGLAGFFTVELIHARTGLVARRLEFPNMVVDAGLDYLAAGRLDTIGYVGVGTSNVAPAANQTDLLAPLVRTNSTTGVPTSEETGLSGDNLYVFRRYTRQFSTAQANGNLAEVGAFQLGSGGTMLARNLFQDVGGNPTIVTKTSEYELRVTYEIRVYPEPDDLVYTATINGVPDVGVTGRAYGHIVNQGGIWNFSTPLGLPSAFTNSYAFLMAGVTALQAWGTQSPTFSGSSSQHSNTTSASDAYVNGTFYRDHTIEWGSAVANVAGINAVRIGSVHSYVHLFDTSFDKTNVQKVVLRARRQWGRHV